MSFQGSGQSFVMARSALEDLFRAIQALGYEIVGPTIRDGAIVYAELKGADDLPIGWTDVQGPGSYRLEHRADGAVVGFAVGPHSVKKYLLPPSLRLWRANRDSRGAISVEAGAEPPRKLAVFGLRSCELHAIAIQDKVLAAGAHPDPHYASQRQNLLLVAVNCMTAGATCFCSSMRTGPRATHGYDLALTELVGDRSHEFVIEVGSGTGARVMEGVPHRVAGDAQIAAAGEVTRRTAAAMGRSLATDGIKELLYANLENSRWDEVASRCLACTNCTMVCPTCFCTSVEDRVELGGSVAERVRVWDSCHTMDFSHLHGGSVRGSIKARYRQWLTHKLASWIDQFGSSGCVGCGRCIAWCPVGIDITEEAAAIRATDLRKRRMVAANES
jgi:sulfhydrogenase subunit beta (sulfur reductase)